MFDEESGAMESIEKFARPEAASGIFLLVSTLIALAWVNSPWAASYAVLWRTAAGVSMGQPAIRGDLHWWVNDGLMTLFFFVVGLEIKRELMVGELASPRRAALPIVAAIGGVVVPAAIYSAVNAHGPGRPGWGIPMATDIAFAMGVLALLGRRVPLSLRVFMTALAIVDDLVAVVVIALFYTPHISWIGLGAAAVCFSALLAANRLGVGNALPYAVLGFFLWGSILQSGVHPTIAGVLLAVTIPCRTRLKPTQSLLEQLEHRLHPWVTFVVMPLFALANAGIALNGRALSSIAAPVPLGIVLGLVLGKPAGITLAAWVAVRLRLAALPSGMTWMELHAAGWLGGIGFTMSIFVAGLAFASDTLLNEAKLGIFTASLLAGSAGSSILYWRSANRSRGRF